MNLFLLLRVRILFTFFSFYINVITMRIIALEHFPAFLKMPASIDFPTSCTLIKNESKYTPLPLSNQRNSNFIQIRE